MAITLSLGACQEPLSNRKKESTSHAKSCKRDEAVQSSVQELFAHVGDPINPVFVPRPTFHSIKPHKLRFIGGSTKNK